MCKNIQFRVAFKDCIHRLLLKAKRYPCGGDPCRRPNPFIEVKNLTWWPIEGKCSRDCGGDLKVKKRLRVSMESENINLTAVGEALAKDTGTGADVKDQVMKDVIKPGKYSTNKYDVSSDVSAVYGPDSDHEDDEEEYPAKASK